MLDDIQPPEGVPEVSAPVIPLYPQFVETTVPAKSGALRAYKGYIRPFSDDTTARRVLRGLAGNETIIVSAGRLDIEAPNLSSHPLEDYLINMAEPCTVIVLEFGGLEHPRAYLLDPQLVQRESQNPHLRPDLALTIEGRRVPALCVYSGSVFKYDPAYERLPQFLNQLSTYLAKHLIFLRTRMLSTIDKNLRVKLYRSRKPDEPIPFNTLKLLKKFILFGQWVGPAAPTGPLQHLQTIHPDEECWCTSGRRYRDCHRFKEESSLTQRG